VQLVNRTPTTVNAESYARIVERASIRRRLLEASGTITKLAYDEELSIEEVIEEAEVTLLGVSDNRIQRDFVPIRDALENYYDRMEALLQERGRSIGVPSGFTDLDKITGGWQKSDLLVFAGRPGMGKTSFLLSTAMNAARLGARVAIFTMEMGVEQVVQRIVSMETGIKMGNLRTASISAVEERRFTEVISRLAPYKIFIDDTPSLTPQDIRSKCRRLKHEQGIDLILVDYMQLMNAGRNFANNRVQEISFISRNLKEIAREMDVPLISAAQLSRAVEARQDKRPVLSDLRESGSIEQDADIVMFLYREEVYDKTTENQHLAEILIRKHRNGPTAEVQLYFESEKTQFVDAKTGQSNLNKAYAS
jgi:replicative DNA helicase